MSASLRISLGLSRMWRTWTSSRTIRLPPRFSSTLIMMKPPGVRTGSVTSPTDSEPTMLSNGDGSWAALRQPISPPSRALSPAEWAIAIWLKSAPWRSCWYTSLALRPAAWMASGEAPSGTGIRMLARRYSSESWILPRSEARKFCTSWSVTWMRSATRR
ncbi:hypothetical protein D3C81_1361720 [compost metagenome]